MAGGSFRFALRGFRWPSVTTIITVLVIIGLWSWTGSNSFCGRLCHTDNREYQAWQKSTHAKVDCVVCHRAGGRFSFIGNKVFAVDRIVRTTYQKVSRQDVKVNPDSKLADVIPSSVCIKCHSLNRITPSKGIIIDHKKHADKQINCTTCHNRVAHAGIEEYKDFMTMHACYRCHGTDERAIAMVKCGACHSEYFFPKTHRPLDFVSKTHIELSKKDPDYCIMCHRRQLCTDCHDALEVGKPKAKKELTQPRP